MFNQNAGSHFPKKLFFLFSLFVILLVVSCGLGDGYPYGDYPTDEQIAAIPIRSQYNIASMAATFPVLYFGLSVLDGTIDTTDPTFYHLGRTGTLNQSALLPLNVKMVPGVAQKNYYGDETIAENLGRKLYERDNSTHITFYGEDVRAQLGISFMYKQHIPEQNLDIVMLSDGSYSKNANILRYANSANPAAQLDADRATVRKMIAQAKLGITPDTIGNMMLAFILEMPNATWWYNGASSLPTDVPALAGITKQLLQDGRIIDVQTATLFTAVQNAGKLEDAKAIFNMANIAGSDLNNGKKTLIVMGTRTELEMVDTSTTSLNIGGAALPELMDAVIANYGNDYNIFYKGHPGTPTVDGSNKQIYFKNHNIQEISDASIPAEMLMYLIDDVYIGGYPGTTFQSSKDDQTLFFFSEPTKFLGILGGLNNPDYFLHGNTYFIYKDGANGIVMTPVQESQISK